MKEKYEISKGGLAIYSNNAKITIVDSNFYNLAFAFDSIS